MESLNGIKISSAMNSSADHRITPTNNVFLHFHGPFMFMVHSSLEETNTCRH